MKVMGFASLYPSYARRRESWWARFALPTLLAIEFCSGVAK